LNSGIALLNNTFNTGTFGISAVYAGNSLFASSSSSTTSIVLTAITTSTILNISNAAILSGEYMTLSAFVTPAVSVGTVTFTSNIDGTLSAVKVINGTSVYSLSTLSLGVHTFAANYNSIGCYAPSTGGSTGSVSEPVVVDASAIRKSTPLASMPW
jgi:hypothetical protein